RAALRCSSSRIRASRSGVIDRSLEPLFPLVTMTYVTSRPSLTIFATVPPAPNSESSGCAVTTITRSILSAIEPPRSFGCGSHCQVHRLASRRASPSLRGRRSARTATAACVFAGAPEAPILVLTVAVAPLLALLAPSADPAPSLNRVAGLAAGAAVGLVLWANLGVVADLARLAGVPRHAALTLSAAA